MDETFLEESIDFALKFAQKYNVEFFESAVLSFNKERISAFIAQFFGLPTQMVERLAETWLLVRIVKDSRLFEASVNIDTDFKTKVSRVIEKMLTVSKDYGKQIHSEWLESAPDSNDSEKVERQPRGSITLEEVLKNCKETVMKIGEDSQRIFINLAQIGETFVYGNQNGARLQHKSSGFSLIVGAMVANDAKSTLKYSSPDPSTIVSDKIIDDAQFMFKSFSGAKKTDLSDVDELVLDPCLAGFILHMACHHSAPSRKPTTNSVCILDDPSCPSAFHNYFFDDEGTKAKATVLIDKEGYQHEISDRFAAIEPHRPTGHYRRWPPSFRPQLSLSHTHVAGGECSDDEIFELGRGIYARGYRDFWKDNEGTLHVIPREAFLVRKKDILHPLPRVQLFFDIQNIVSGISLAGRTMTHSSPLSNCPNCHEHVSVCAPQIRMKGVRIEYVE